MAKTKGYTVTAIYNGKKYSGTGKDIVSALESLTIKSPKGKMILTVENGNKSKERIVLAPQVNRLFSHGLMREVALKQISSLFDGI